MGRGDLVLSLPSMLHNRMRSWRLCDEQSAVLGRVSDDKPRRKRLPYASDLVLEATLCQLQVQTSSDAGMTALDAS